MSDIIRIGHSPDPDDAFMFYAMLNNKIDNLGLNIEECVEDIESLNNRALNGELEMTAISWHLLSKVYKSYAVLDPGASMGLGYGPVLIANKDSDISFPDLKGAKVALPGPHTTATLIMRIFASNFVEEFVPFDEIMASVKNNDVDVGLLIHEGQITYEEEGFKKIVDYGELWHEESGGLPLPLGTNAISKDVDYSTAKKMSKILLDSIVWGEKNRQETNDYARDFGRGLSEDKNDRFIKMYVNNKTISLGEEGVAAVNLLFKMAFEKGLIEEMPDWDLIKP